MVVAIFVLLFLFSSAVFAVWRATRLWRDSAYFSEVAGEARVYPFKKDVQRGLVRGWVPFAAGTSALAVGMPAIIVADSLRGASMWLLIGMALVLVFLAGIALQIVIAWFNRPAVLVPPYLRDEPGVWSQRREAKARRRRSRRS